MPSGRARLPQSLLQGNQARVQPSPLPSGWQGLRHCRSELWFPHWWEDCDSLWTLELKGDHGSCTAQALNKRQHLATELPWLPGPENSGGHFSGQPRLNSIIDPNPL